MKSFYVYAYLDPRKSGGFVYDHAEFVFEPFYVGKGCGSRYKMFLTPSRCAKFPHIGDRILEIRASSGQGPLIEIIQNNLTEETAFKLEKNLLEEIGRAELEAGPLLNRASGGRGAPGVPLYHLYRIVAPHGKVFHVRSLTGFCREFCLDKGAMSKVTNGKWAAYKGWTGTRLSQQEAAEASAQLPLIHATPQP